MNIPVVFAVDTSLDIDINIGSSWYGFDLDSGSHRAGTFRELGSELGVDLGAPCRRFREGGGWIAVLFGSQRFVELHIVILSAELEDGFACFRNALGANFSKSWNGGLDGESYDPSCITHVRKQLRSKNGATHQ